MQSTARDFWKVIYDKKCGVIVMLCNLMEDGKVTSVCVNMCLCVCVYVCACVHTYVYLSMCVFV